MVKSIQQSKTYDPSGKYTDGRIASNYSVDEKDGGGNGFQPGSTFKALTLATWLKAGKSLNASLPAGPGTLPYTAFKACGDPLRGATYRFSNAGDGEGSGSKTIWQGTAGSINGTYVRMEAALDLCDIRKTAESIGVHPAAPRLNECPGLEKGKTTTRLPICIPSLTLGVSDVSPMTMANAYASFAAQGTYCKPVAITSIKNRTGKSLKIPDGDCKQALDKDVANGVTLGLSKVFSAGGTAARLGGIGRPASGKTGTTNGSIDTWFVGYTPQLSTAVWVGDPVSTPRRSLNYRTIGGVRYGSVYGATIAGPIWKDIMVKAMEGLPVEKFDTPDSKYTRTENATIPPVVGKDVNQAKALLEGAGFDVTVDSDPVRSSVPTGRVASASPSPGSRAPIGSTVTIRISAGGGGGGGGNEDNRGPGNNNGNGNGNQGGLQGLFDDN